MLRGTHTQREPEMSDTLNTIGVERGKANERRNIPSRIERGMERREG
jgi:hypothetical protein